MGLSGRWRRTYCDATGPNGGYRLQLAITINKKPVLLLHGSRTPPFYRAVVSAVADQLGHPHVHEIPGAAHLGPQVTPEPVAGELARFFTRAHVAA